MAVVKKQRQGFVTYYVVTYFQGRTWPAERVGNGRDKREAERLDERRKREVAAGTYQPPGSAAAPKSSTLDSYAELWGNERTNVSAKDDRRNLARFRAIDWLAGMAVPDVRPKHVIAALKQLRGSISEKTLRNAYGTLNTMFRDAVIAELTMANPCVLPRNFFDADAAEERTPYTRAEAAVLVSHHKIPSPIRVLNALCLLGGMREGEACGRRWRDLDQQAVPLMCLHVATQYGGQQLKTKKQRWVPVHPELAAILQEWAAGDFAALMGRLPEPDDFIVPRLSNYTRKRHWTRSTYYKAFIASAREAGIETRTLHATRHTMITLARRGGADRQVLSKVTHNAKGEIIDRYTHHEWEPLCAAVLAIGSLFGARPSPRRPGDNAEQNWVDLPGTGAPMLPESNKSHEVDPYSIPGASTDTEAKKGCEKEERQSRRQSLSEDSADFGALLVSADSDERTFAEALAEHPGAHPPARPPTKTRPVGYVARPRAGGVH